MIRSMILIGLACLISLTLDGQRRALRGQVFDHNQVALPDVEIFVNMKKIKAKTNKKGKYRIRSEEAINLITVYSEELGFINWKYNGEKKVDFVYPENTSPLSREDFLALGYSEPVIEEHTKNFYASYSNILEILDKRFPDVRVNNGQIIVGRAGPNAVTTIADPLVLVNDVPTSVSSLATIPTVEVKSINVISKGSEAATYGVRGMNGVIVVKLKTGDEQN